ncbi:Rsd/AlgQ family anti-sigma factor [Marinomonas sp. UCMA 3892]|jgi:regulator of sigma D|uniref:Regulator of sigma D n=1 Tax=Marinomonas sp. (strain MWYL1) TaxID=400668 RepID=A6VTB7_MARMS|nr:Rsd/AlgQ family anti-sigma factor [Marinomonas sp. UCMA 3892]NLU96840.1 Rsd/AlgQ family anti-sigma factor [Marinomonas sp. UCMA 3892]
MLEGCKTAQERWGGVHVIIDRWLEQRRQLLEMGIYLRERGELTPMDTPKIQLFCEQLVDYVSAGHFTVYEQLALEAKEFHDDGAVILLRELLPLIDSTTEVAIEFNDKYDTKEHCNAQLEALPFSLQALAIVMAERFQYEDQLIKELHEAHSEKSV